MTREETVELVRSTWVRSHNLYPTLKGASGDPKARDHYAAGRVLDALIAAGWTRPTGEA